MRNTLIVALFLGSRLLGGAVDFQPSIQPLLARYCVGCHGEESQEGELRLDALSPRIESAANGRVVLRRLNRVEYENTLNAIFGIQADVRDLLAEDCSAHGFDDVGHALNLSSVLLERYLKAADAALDLAIDTSHRPETKKVRVSYKNERRVKDHKSFQQVEDALVFFSSGYSPTEINRFRAPA